MASSSSGHGWISSIASISGGADEADRVGEGRGSVLRSVEVTALCDTISGDDADESALTDLACSADQDDAGVSRHGTYLRRGATWDWGVGTPR